MPLNLQGPFYAHFVGNVQAYSDADKACIEQTVEGLLSVQTSADRPGMLLGKIQSGKTRTFMATIGLCFDNGFDIGIVLTKGTRALARQTLERVRREFAPFCELDRLQLFDIMAVPDTLAPYELSQKLVFVAKKQSDNLERLIELFRSTYPQLAEKRVLIVDDEADYASIGFRNTPQQGLTANNTTQQINSLRQLLASSAFLQVTATPYALYLQPNDLEVNGVEFMPVRPAFTQLVPVNPHYIGSDYYFERSQERDTVASFIYHPVTITELEILRRQDGRRFRPEDCLISPGVQSLRTAICNFIVGVCIRRLQDQRANITEKKFSFLVHTESQRAAHDWQETIVSQINSQLTSAVTGNPELLRQLFTAAYEDLARSLQILGTYLPPVGEALELAFNALRSGWLVISVVNSERQVLEQLDAQGQLRLRTPLNIFIGGQILDRGLTLANLIGFFYGRRPQVYQQDTVLQHSRMFGFRPIEDLAVTRFYTEPAIHTAMRRMHESDVALRQTLEEYPQQPVTFIQRDAGGRIKPCSPNKILISNTTTLRPFKRILPVGFQTDAKSRVQPIVREIDKILEQSAPSDGREQPFKISLSVGLELLTKIEQTLVMELEMGYEFDWAAARAALEYMSYTCANNENRGFIWVLVRTDRNISRFQPQLGEPFFSDAPDSGQREGAIAREVAADLPMLLMIRQNGEEAQGWRGTPFYWPVIMAPANTRLAIFAHETTP